MDSDRGYALLTDETAEGKEALRLLKQAVANWHPDLAGQSLALMFKYGVKAKKGRVKLGSATVMSNKLRELSGYDAVVELNASAWLGMDGYQPMGEKKRLALIDHELSHLTVEVTEQSGECVLKARDHDITEFTAVIKRHGAWNENLKEMVEVMQQLELFPEPAVA